MTEKQSPEDESAMTEEDLPLSESSEMEDGAKAKPESKKGLFQKEKTVKLSESDYEKLVEEAADYKDRYYRMAAEFENVRKRMERDRQEFVKYANAGLITEFLNIMDDLERSVQVAKEKHQDYDAFLKGIEMVMAHIYEMLRKNQVKPIEAAGKPFDPNCHEILMQEETDEVDEGTVLQEFQKGYFYGDRVVRTAKVKLARAKQAAASQEEAEPSEPPNQESGDSTS